MIGHLRTEFAHDENLLAPADCRDVVGHFLKRHRGPDYMFASTAGLILRSLGYPTHVVTGFYADSKRYDRRAGQTSVVCDDTHFWLEVGLTSGVWLPVEPTPGYEPPRMARNYREMILAFLAESSGSIRAHWALALFAVTLAFAGVWRRRLLLDAIACLIWRGRLLGGPRHAVLATMWLLEQRARLAGCGRPPERTLAQWHGPRLRTLRSNSAQTNLGVLQLFDWVLYAPRRTIVCPVSETEVRRMCREAVRSASLAAMRGVARS